ESKQKGELFFVLELRGERMQEHYQYLKTIPAFKTYFDYAVSVGFYLPETQIHHLANFSQGNLLFITLEPCPEFHDVFKRFGKVFEQTYTRFLDLQKAEAQAKESQIQLALERVRSKTMAMHNSQDVSAATAVMFNELSRLGVEKMRCGIGILQKDSDLMEVWSAAATKDGHEIKGTGLVSIKSHVLWQQMYADWEAKKESFLYYLEGSDREAYYKA